MKIDWSDINLDLMKESGSILSGALKFAGSLVESNMSASVLDKALEEFILAAKAKPSFKGFNGFPNASCISINDEVVHGIPSQDNIFVDGDLVTVDVGVEFKGHNTDAARTFVVGGSSSDLVSTTKEALKEAILAVVPGETLGTIGFVIQLTAEMNGFNVPVHFGGHGIGLEPHTWPFIPNYGVRGRGVAIEEGMYLAIEPILFDGNNSVVQSQDGWTMKSPSGVLSAHFEDTIYVSSEGAIVLTI